MFSHSRTRTIGSPHLRSRNDRRSNDDGARLARRQRHDYPSRSANAVALYGASARCNGPARGNRRDPVQYAEAERIDVASIPVIDLAGLSDGGQAMSAIGRHMLAAAESVGFFYIRNHGIPASLIDAVFAVSARFLGEPLARKQDV